MARYGKAASRNVERVMKKLKRGKLRSGSGGKVTRRDQAVAIALSESRRQGAKVPRTRGKRQGA